MVRMIKRQLVKRALDMISEIAGAPSVLAPLILFH